MDQIKIGKFIASCRKEQGLTQATLAEKLQISDRAVSKWETGKSMPNSGIMLELCDLLKINVNELLSGERFMKEAYDTKAEENLLAMRKEIEEQNKLLLRLEYGIGFPAVIAAVLLILFAAFSDLSDGMRAILITLSAILIFTTAFTGVWIEQKAGYYECANCGYTYKPAYLQVLMAPHIGRSRKMKCPHCGMKNYHKKVTRNGPYDRFSNFPPEKA